MDNFHAFTYTVIFEGNGRDLVLIDRSLRWTLWDFEGPKDLIYVGNNFAIKSSLFTDKEPLIIPLCRKHIFQVAPGTKAKFTYYPHQDLCLPSLLTTKNLTYENEMLGVKDEFIVKLRT